jgi:hypothetical protein
MRYKILSALAAVTLAGAACSNITDVNQNPNGPLDVAPPSILASVQQGILSNYTFNAGYNATYTGTWAQQLAEIQYPDEDRYIVRNTATGGWPLFYGAAEDAQRIINKGLGGTPPAPNWEAVGRIMKSYAFEIMTDAMGDLPYTDAFKGDSLQQPAYDTQQAIYDSLFASLTKASGEIDLSSSALGFSSGDLIYDGDMAEWRKLANSLRLRLAIHLSEVDPTTGKAEAAAAVAAGVFTSNDDNAGLNYLTSAPNQNPIYTNALTRDDYGMSKTFVDSLQSINDPRLAIYAAPYDTLGHYAGKPNGMLGTNVNAPPNSKVSRIGDYWRRTPNATMYFMTYSEVLLLEAEAAERGWIAGNPATLYQQAITASLEQWGISAADISTYLAQPAVQFDAKGANACGDVPSATCGHLTQIDYQLWIQLYLNGEEAWTQVRRTHVPSLLPGPDIQPAGHAGVLNSIPERLPYDAQEEVLNQTNVDAAVARQGFSAGNDIFTPLWFTGRAP